MARHANGASSLFHAGHTRRKLRAIRFRLRNSDQLAFLDLPEVRYWLMWQRRVLIVSAATRLLDVCSLNAAARMLDVSSSWLCTLLQAFRAGGDSALKPRIKTPLAGAGCRLSVYLRI